MAEKIYPVTVPKWGIEMSEGNIVAWHVDEGNKVNKGDELIDIETDKIVNTMEAPTSGVLRRRIVDEGETLSVGALLGVIASSETDDATIDKFITEFKPADASFAFDDKDSGTKEPISTATVKQAPAQGKVRISPVAAQRARELGVDVSMVTGTGRGGRISEEDVEAYAKQVVQRSTQESNRQPYETVPLSPIRKIIAKRLQESKQTIPHFYLTTEIEMDKTLQHRDTVNATADEKISVNSLVVRATVLALQAVPEVNIHLVDNEIRKFKNINIAIAVATDEGLVTPVVKQAEMQSLTELSLTINDLSVRARNNTLKPDEMRDATFTVSNLGMLGITEFQAIINPPQGAVLAVGATQATIVPDGDRTRAVKKMCVTLSCDHRAIDGALGAQFLAKLKAILEDPKDI